MIAWIIRGGLACIAFSTLACDFCPEGMARPVGTHSVTSCVTNGWEVIEPCPVVEVRFGPDMSSVRTTWGDDVDAPTHWDLTDTPPY